MKRGFTLIELLIVIAILAILIVLIGPPLRRYLNPNANPPDKPAPVAQVMFSASTYHVDEIEIEGRKYLVLVTSGVAHYMMPKPESMPEKPEGK